MGLGDKIMDWMMPVLGTPTILEDCFLGAFLVTHKDKAQELDNDMI